MKQTVMYTEYVTGGDDMSDIIEKEGVSFVSFRLFAPYKDLTAAVSTRLRRHQHGEILKVLNMSFSTGDDKEAVKENRRRYFNALGISIKRPGGVQSGTRRAY